MVQKLKQKLLFNNCKCFVEKKNSGMSVFLLKGPPAWFPSYEPGFISVNFDYFLIDGDHS